MWISFPGKVVRDLYLAEKIIKLFKQLKLVMLTTKRIYQFYLFVIFLWRRNFKGGYKVSYDMVQLKGKFVSVHMVVLVSFRILNCFIGDNSVADIIVLTGIWGLPCTEILNLCHFALVMLRSKKTLHWDTQYMSFCVNTICHPKYFFSKHYCVWHTR